MSVKSTVGWIAALAAIISSTAFGAVPELADPYVDGSFGFSIRPPKGWRLIRERLPEESGVTVLRMVGSLGPGQYHEIALRRTATTEPLKEVIQEEVKGLHVRYSDIEIRAQQIQTIAGHPGAFLSATLMSEGVKKLWMQALIEIKPQEYYVLLYEGPAVSMGDAEPLFQMVLNSFRLLKSDIDESALKAGMQAAGVWLASLNEQSLRGLVGPSEYYIFEAEGRPIGFLGVDCSTGKREGREGLWVRERAWTFGEHGWARRLQTNMFLSWNGKQEHWKTSVSTLEPAAGEQPEWLDVGLEEGLRVERLLLTNQVYQINQPTTENPPIEELPAYYIPRALIRRVPRLVSDPGKKELFVFSGFDHNRAGLVMHVADFKGPKESPRGVEAGKVFLLEDREGLAAEPSKSYLDAKGRLLLMESGSLRMRPSDWSKLERLFSDRLRLAERKMDELEKTFNADMQRWSKRRGKS